MPAGRPWYQRNPTDFIVGTIGWDLELRGAYSLLIDILNERDRPIPDDARFVAGFLGVSPRKWGQLRQRLLDSGKITLTDDGQLTNPRFERERAQRRQEHDDAVENGRRGGRKSAAMRAAGQGDLDLGTDDAPVRARPERPDIDAENAAKTPRKRDENGAKTKDNLEINGQERLISANPDQPPPQAPRARDRSEIRDIEQTDDHLDLPPGRARAPARESRSSPLDDGPLRDASQRCFDAAGFHSASPTHIAAAHDTVRQWLDLGIDIDGLAIPTIRSVIAQSNDPTTSFQRRFDKRVRLEHAKRSAQPSGAPYRPPASPILEPDGEDPAFRPIRRDLLADIGAVAYCSIYNSVQLSERIIGLEPNTRRLIDARGGVMAQRARDHPTLARLARQHGFDGVS